MVIPAAEGLGGVIGEGGERKRLLQFTGDHVRVQINYHHILHLSQRQRAVYYYIYTLSLPYSVFYWGENQFPIFERKILKSCETGCMHAREQRLGHINTFFKEIEKNLLK